jgi:hypothetical protein
MKQKPTLRLFADYCCGFALWNSHDHDILDGSEEQLLEFGVSEKTMILLKAIVHVHDWEDSHKESTPECDTTYKYLINMAKIRLEREIGDKFKIVLLD